MATIVWLGEPTGDDDGPRKNVWNGVTFPRGEPVEVTNEYMIRKARKNPFYSVDGKTYDPDQDAGQANETEVQGAQREPAGPVRPNKSQLSEMNVAELRELADKRGIAHDGMTKAELRDRLAH